MNYLVYSALTFAVYGYCGLGLVLWVTPKERRHYALVLAPWVGYCYLTVIAWLFYRYELAVTDHYAPWVMAPPLLFLYLGWRKLAKEKATLGDCVSLRDVLLFIPMLI